MYFSDKPIEDVTQDKFGRANFSRQLAKAIVSLNVEDSFCIGLFGEWGSGKSSVLNMAIQEINLLADSMDYESRPVVIQFNPWNFSDSSQLLSQFFSVISNKLRIDDRNKKLVTVGDAIEQYSTALSYTEYIPLIGKYLKLIPTLTKTVGTNMKSNAERELTDASIQKSAVASALKAQKHKIIVVMDDIDRLSNEQIRQIFQLVNTVAGFPNIVYVLSFDKDIVVRALEKVQDCDGNKYLEKIIQVPFQLPQVNKDRLWSVFVERVENTLEGRMFKQIGQEYWSNMFWNCVAPYINDLRDINRIINAIQLKSGLLGEEVNYADLVALSTIEMIMPEIYTWILNNKNKLVGGTPYEETSSEKQLEREKHYIEKFNNLTNYRARDVVGSIATMFPKFASEIGHYYCLATDEELICDLRIAHFKLFDLYFSLSTDSVSISRGDLNEAIYKMDEQELKKYVLMLCENQLGIDYVYEFNCNIRRIPRERLPLMIKTFMELSQVLSDSRGNKAYAMLQPDYVEQSIFSLFMMIKNEEDVKEIIEACISNGTVEYIKSITNILNRIGRGYDIYGANTLDAREQLVTKEQYTKIMKLYFDKIMQIKSRVNIFLLPNYDLVLKMWNIVDHEQMKNFLAYALKEVINQIKFITLYCREYNNGNGIVYAYDNKYTEFIDNETIVNAIEKCVKVGYLEHISENEGRKIAAFVLHNNGADAENGYLTEEMVITAMKEFM